MWRLIASALGVLAFAAAIVYGVRSVYTSGYSAGKAEMATVLAEWKASVEKQATERREAQHQRYQQLQGEFDELRSRPEKVRTVVRKIEVRADDICGSLPSDWRLLWNAAYESGVRMGSAAATAGLDDAGRVAVADAAAAAAEARERFEANAAALTALQQYIRSVVMQDTEKTK